MSPSFLCEINTSAVQPGSNLRERYKGEDKMEIEAYIPYLLVSFMESKVMLRSYKE